MKKPTHEVETDYGTVLDKDTYAITWNSDGGFQILMPKLSDNSPLPADAVALIGAMILLTSDKNFYNECIEVFTKQKKN